MSDILGTGDQPEKEKGMRGQLSGLELEAFDRDYKAYVREIGLELRPQNPRYVELQAEISDDQLHDLLEDLEDEQGVKARAYLQTAFTLYNFDPERCLSIQGPIAKSKWMDIVSTLDHEEIMPQFRLKNAYQLKKIDKDRFENCVLNVSATNPLWDSVGSLMQQRIKFGNYSSVPQEYEKAAFVNFSAISNRVALDSVWDKILEAVESISDPVEKLAAAAAAQSIQPEIGEEIIVTEKDWEAAVVSLKKIIEDADQEAKQEKRKAGLLDFMAKAGKLKYLRVQPNEQPTRQTDDKPESYTGI